PAASPARAHATSADAFAWLRPAAMRLVRDGAWSGSDAAALDRDATWGDLEAVLTRLDLPFRPVADPTRPVSVWAAHVRVVRALGLVRELRGLHRIHTADGTRLRVPRYFGAEVLVRELGLVVNHPAEHDDQERGRAQRLRMADLAHMASALDDLSEWRLAGLERYRDISLPQMTSAERSAVQAAFAQVGRPYVWGGDWPGRRSPWGWQGAAGFDCSGLVWWTFKGARTTRGLATGPALRGRTADDMAHESLAARIEPDQARAGDLIFFGSEGPRTPRGAISHVGIALGGGWIVHSSGSRGGPTVSHLENYWSSGVAWGRRVPGLR
ncbi:MAG: C40 family peptidase, partial [Miltoncostaeaceae bacterium]